MKDLIAAFPKHLESALEIGRNTRFSTGIINPKNVLIIGLGGSGIGGTIVREWVSNNITVPVRAVKSYFIPGWVNQDTLVIACSYSGNTEETLSAFDAARERGAQLACITSGGALLDMAKKEELNHIQIPGGNPPRSMLGFSICSLLFVLNKYGLISSDFISSIVKAEKLLIDQQTAIRKQAQEVAGFMKGKTPILYGADHIEGVLIRWRQQINENAKMLTWHHVIPEMNHNELVGWRKESEDYAVIFLRSEADFERIQKRIEINKEVIQTYCPNVLEIWAEGEDEIQRALFFIHLGDWVSYYLSEMNGFDPTEIEVINRLKSELSKF